MMQSEEPADLFPSATHRTVGEKGVASKKLMNKLLSQAVVKERGAVSAPRKSPVDVARGKQSKWPKRGKSLMKPLALAQLHPFASTLEKWEHGVPVDCGAPWSQEAIMCALQKGAHTSACTPESVELIDEELEYQVSAGFSSIILWDDIKDCLPKNFKLSPLAVVPQVNRRGRMILDLSFPVRKLKKSTHKRRRVQEEIIQESVNDTTRKLAPTIPVKLLGQVLPRLFEFMAIVHPSDAIHFSKIDLSDGFWRMIVEDAEKWNFCYVKPQQDQTAPIQIVVPSALQMGWTESPPFFSSATETCRDIIDIIIKDDLKLPEHEFEVYMKPEPNKKKRSRTRIEAQPKQNREHSANVFVDDFCLAAVENDEQSWLQLVGRAALHAIHNVFPRPEEVHHQNGKNSISEKKLKQGDARWDTRKLMLGFELDGVAKTARLPQDKSTNIRKEIKRLVRKRKVNLKRFQRIIGKCRHATNILPSARGLYTPINKALAGNPKEIGLGKNSEVRANLLDIGILIKDLARRPTHVKELVPLDVDLVGYCDASLNGAGGVWFSEKRSMTPLVWNIEFPDNIKERFHQGLITNSDLELAGVLLHYCVLEANVDVRHRAVATFCDNTPAVAWIDRMASKADTPIAGRLLRGLAIRQRCSRSSPLITAPIAGEQNTMADFASRSFTSRSQFVNNFNFKFPLPQTQSWQIAMPTLKMKSNVFSTLLGNRLPLQLWMTNQGLDIGKSGSNTAVTAESIPSCQTLPNQSSMNCSFPLLSGSGKDMLVKEKQLVHKQLQPGSGMLPRTQFWQDTLIPGNLTETSN